MEYRMNILVFATVLAISYGQLIIPKRPLGYIYGSGTRDAPVHLDVHLGPLCPDSAATFPTLKQVADHYGNNNIVLVLHMFPLPYHHQAFFVAKGAQVVRKYGAGDTTAYSWFRYFYENLDKYSNTNTANMTANQVIDQLADVAVMLGVQKTTFLQGMGSTEMEINTRAAWKYSCSRGIASTPTYLLNDIIVQAQQTWTLADWKRAIDPFLAGPINVRNFPASLAETSDCPSGEVKCEYLPGKVECCLKGENCIPNVGCRCLNAPC